MGVFQPGCKGVSIVPSTNRWQLDEGQYMYLDVMDREYAFLMTWAKP